MDVFLFIYKNNNLQTNLFRVIKNHLIYLINHNIFLFKIYYKHFHIK
jgi:hypothetical protein